MTNPQEVALMQALMRLRESRERLRDVLDRLEKAHGLAPLPPEGLELQQELEGHAAGLARATDALIDLVKGKAVAA